MPAGRSVYDREKTRGDYKYIVGLGADGRFLRSRVRRREGRGQRVNEVAREGARPFGDPRQRDCLRGVRDPNERKTDRIRKN